MKTAKTMKTMKTMKTTTAATIITTLALGATAACSPVVTQCDKVQVAHWHSKDTNKYTVSYRCFREGVSKDVTVLESATKIPQVKCEEPR